MEKQHHIDAKELFQRFLRGDLNKAEEALLRKEAEADPFLAEAIAGIDGGGAEDHQSNLIELRKKLALAKEDKKRTIIPWRVIGAVAAVGILLIIGSQLWQNNMPNAAMGDQLKKEAPVSNESKAPEKFLGNSPKISPNNSSADDSNEYEINAETQEEIKETKFNYQTGANEVKLRKQNNKSPITVIDSEPINAKKTSKENAPSTAKPEPPSVKIKKDNTISSSQTYAGIEEEAEELQEIDVETAAEIEETANIMSPDLSQERKMEAQEAKKEKLDDYQDSAYYTDSGLLIETDFDKNDSSFIYTGNVFDSDGIPLIGANILVEGTDYATTTDFNGGFVLASPKRLPTLEVFYLGYEPSRIRPYRNDDNLSIFLAENNTSLDEVVITSDQRNLSKAKTSPISKTLSYQPKGGYAKWGKYLNKNLKKPKQARSNKISGKVVLSFTINDSGEVSNIEVKESLGYGCDEEAIRLLKEGPKWMTNNKNVETLGKVTISF